MTVELLNLNLQGVVKWSKKMRARRRPYPYRLPIHWHPYRIRFKPASSAERAPVSAPMPLPWTIPPAKCGAWSLWVTRMMFSGVKHLPCAPPVITVPFAVPGDSRSQRQWAHLNRSLQKKIWHDIAKAPFSVRILWRACVVMAVSGRWNSFSRSKPWFPPLSHR